MKTILFFLGIICLQANAQTKLIKAAAYLDVRAGKIIKPANLLIEDDLIKAVNPTTIPGNAVIIDLGNQILLPGLMDMHVHLDLDLIPNYQYLTVTESGAKNALRAAKNAEATLLAGFTTVRNMGQVHPSIELIDVALAEASDEKWVKAPRIFPCGHMIGITGGHADLSMMGGFAEHVMDLGPEYGMADGKDEALKAVRYQMKHGAKVIKIMATAGVMSLEESVGTQQMTSEEMETIVAEATRHHVTVAAHAHGTGGIIAAINAGVTSIEHGSYLNDEAIKLMLSKGTFLVPTTALLDLMTGSFEKMNPKLVEKAKIVLPNARKSHTAAIKAGVKIALGTDAMLNLKDRGEIREGLLADIIAVSENPLDNIKTLEAVKFVMKGGTVYKQER